MHGHSGDPANELADALAARGAITHCSSPFCMEWGRWFQDMGSAFEWLPHLCWSRLFPQCSPSTAHGLITWDRQEPPARLSADAQMAPFLRALPADVCSSVGASIGVPATVKLGLVTYNTLSLADPAAADKGPRLGLHDCVGRVALLDRCLHAHGVFLAGLQETRTPEGTFRSSRFQRYCSGCLEKRAFGVELWIGVGDPWPSHKAVVLHTDYTRLIARVSVDGLSLCVLVGHAPHRGHPLALPPGLVEGDPATLCQGRV